MNFSLVCRETYVRLILPRMKIIFETANIVIVLLEQKMKSGRNLYSPVTIGFVILIVAISKPFYFDRFTLPSGAARLRSCRFLASLLA